MPSVHMQTVLEMMRMIRFKQKGISNDQNRLLEDIVAYYESNPDIVIDNKKIIDFLNELEQSYIDNIKNNISNHQVVGYPIKFQKTLKQIEIVREWILREEENIIDANGMVKFLNGLTNDVVLELPVLGALNTEFYWGNENSSSTSLMLSVINSIVSGKSISQQMLSAAATFYPFFDANFTIENFDKYFFATDKGMYLFGDYQFGGHRYFSKKYSNEFKYAPEDCSSAVGKATGLTKSEIEGIYTGAIKDAFYNENNTYHYKPVTTNKDSVLDIDLVNPGDLYLKGGHVAIILEKDNNGNIRTLDFNRDIDKSENRMLGGGTYSRNINDGEVYILRKEGMSLGETIDFYDLLRTIDNNWLSSSPGPYEDELLLVGNDGYDSVDA